MASLLGPQLFEIAKEVITNKDLRHQIANRINVARRAFHDPRSKGLANKVGNAIYAGVTGTYRNPRSAAALLSRSMNGKW